MIARVFQQVLPCGLPDITELNSGISFDVAVGDVGPADGVGRHCVGIYTMLMVIVASKLAIP